MSTLKVFSHLINILYLVLGIFLLSPMAIGQDENQDMVIDPALEAIQALESEEAELQEPGTEGEEEQPQFGETIIVSPGNEMGDEMAGMSIQKDVILVLDNSGSMKKNDPKFLTNKAVTEFISSLDEATRVAIIIFDQEAHIAVPLTQVLPEATDTILQSLDQINYKGLFTDSPAAIERAIYELKLNGRDDAKKLIIFMTDGIVDTGDTDRDLEKTKWLKEDLAADAADSEIIIFGIAFTEEADFELIQSLAQKTGGEYYRALQAEDINSVFERVHTLINKQPEPEPVPEPEPEVIFTPPPPPPVIEAPQPVIIEVPVQPQAIDEEEQLRSKMILVALLVLIIAVIVMVIMLIRGARKKDEEEEFAPEAYFNDINGYTAKSSYKLGNQPTMLGRVAGKDTEHLDYIVIPETTIGRRHALIEYKDFAYWIIDQGSINGTFVNGQPVTSEIRLKHGDKIRLHKCEFEFSMPDMDDAGMTVISKTVVANQPAAEIDDETVARGSSDADIDEDDLPEPDFDLDVTGGVFDEEDSETPTEMKGSAKEKHDADEESDETIMLDDDGSQSEMDDDATIRPDSMDSK